MSTITRPVCDADLNAFTDQCADAERRGKVLNYLEADPAEYRRVSDWCNQNEAIRRVLGKAAVERFPAAPLRPASSGPVPTKIIRSPPSGSVLPTRDDSPPPSPLWASAVRLVAALIFGFGLGWFSARLGHAPSHAANRAHPAATVGDEANDLRATFANRVLDAHQTFAADALYPVEIPAREKPRLLQWVSNRVGESSIVPDLAGAGFSFLGGRLIPTNTGPAVLFVYENIGGERLGFTVARANLPADKVLRYHAAHGFGVVVWNDQSRLFALSGQADAARLTTIASQIVEQFTAGKDP